jgi:hypothetical protein
LAAKTPGEEQTGMENRRGLCRDLVIFQSLKVDFQRQWFLIHRLIF